MSQKQCTIETRVVTTAHLLLSNRQCYFSHRYFFKVRYLVNCSTLLQCSGSSSICSLGANEVYGRSCKLGDRITTFMSQTHVKIVSMFRLA